MLVLDVLEKQHGPVTMALIQRLTWEVNKVSSCNDVIIHYIYNMLYISELRILVAV